MKKLLGIVVLGLLWCNLAVAKNINGFDLSLNAKQAFNENSDQAVNVSLSRSF